MTTFGIVWLVVMSLGFAVCGWLCVFKTDMPVERGRKSKICETCSFQMMSSSLQRKFTRVRIFDP